MKPRVLFLDHKGSLGGSELSLLDIARDNLETSQVVLLTDGPFRERLEEAGVEVEVLPIPKTVSGISRQGGLGRDLLAIPHVLGLARRVAKLSRKYDLLYANSQKALFIGALAGMMARRPVIWHQRGLLTDPARTTHNYFSGAHRRLAALVSNHLVERVIANSRATAQALVEAGVRADRVRVVHNGIDPSPFEAVTAAEVEDLRGELGLEGVPVVGAFGRLTPWKGQHVLLEALTHLPDVHALLVGDAGPEDENYAKALRQQSKDLGLAHRVHFTGFRRDVPQLMHLSDVVVHTSVAPEPFGRVIVEGMLAGRPVVATRGGGVLEIIDDGINGVLVPPGDARALAETLSTLLINPDRARALSKAGHTTALERFSLQAMLDGVSQHLQETVARRR
jgi:glycosyltransferase involved in cell wall biosynthesis